MSVPGIDSQRRSNLVSETQFAVNLVLTGIRRVSRLPMDGHMLTRARYDQTFPLHVGLHSYTSGLERLCKLALACHGFLEKGSFARVRAYSHQITVLFDALEALDLSHIATGPGTYLTRPQDDYEPELNEWLARYSSGQGRYELLDSLSSGSQTLPTWVMWAEFCSRGAVSPSVRRAINMHHASCRALREIAALHRLESVAAGYLAELDGQISFTSAAVGLAMYRRARWAASVLDAVSYYTHRGLPILGEAVVSLRQTSDDFFAFEIARLSDPEVVEVELLGHRSSFVYPEDDDEDLDCWTTEQEPIEVEASGSRIAGNSRPSDR